MPLPKGAKVVGSKKYRKNGRTVRVLFYRKKGSRKVTAEKIRNRRKRG